MTIKNVVFDWSGTLSNDLPKVYETAMNVFETLNIPRINLDEYKEKFTIPVMDFYRLYLPEDAESYVPDDEIDKLFREFYGEIDIPVEMHRDVKSVLEKLVDKGIKLAIVSTHKQDSLEEEARAYGIHKYFKEGNEKFMIYGDVENKIEELPTYLEELGFDPKETMYVGDLDHDILAGSQAGLKTFAVTWGYNSRERLEAAKPSYIRDDLSDLPNLLS